MVYGDDKTVSAYMDRPCDNYAQFLQIKGELEGDGFKDVGNHFTSEEFYHQKIRRERQHDFVVASVRVQEQFANDVEESTWSFRDQGYEVVRTRGFKADGSDCDGLVAFFVKPPAQE